MFYIPHSQTLHVWACPNIFSAVAFPKKISLFNSATFSATQIIRVLGSGTKDLCKKKIKILKADPARDENHAKNLDAGVASMDLWIQQDQDFVLIFFSVIGSIPL